MRYQESGEEGKLCARKSKDEVLVSTAITCGTQGHVISPNEAILSPHPEVALVGLKKIYVHLFCLFM